MDISDALNSVFPKGSAENDLLTECYGAMLSSVPSIMSEAKNQMYIFEEAMNYVGHKSSLMFFLYLLN